MMNKASLTIDGRIFRTGDTVTTHLGRGTVISVDPFGDLEILVHLFTPVDAGSKLWFSFREVTVDVAPVEWVDGQVTEYTITAEGISAPKIINPGHTRYLINPDGSIASKEPIGGGS